MSVSFSIARNIKAPEPAGSGAFILRAILKETDIPDGEFLKLL
jgi:hypothetical protein